MQGDHVLITGGTGGLGVSVTLEAIARGAKVFLPWHDWDQTEALLKKIEPETRGRQLATHEADLRDEDSVRAMVDVMPQCDALIHLVGGFTMGPTDEVPLEQWRAHHDLTLTTTFLCCKHALRRMKAAGYGRIVTIGSRAAVEPAGQMAAYAAAKSGVIALTRVIADETRGTDITANCVLPGTIDTAANRAAMGEADADKWVKPFTLARIICDLASRESGDVRGAAIPVYGNT